MTDLREHWNEVRTLLLEAMTQTSAALPPEAMDIAAEWLDHNELELALRAIEEAAEEHNIPLPAEAAQHLNRAAYLMRLGSKE